MDTSICVFFCLLLMKWLIDNMPERFINNDNNSYVQLYNRLLSLSCPGFQSTCLTWLALLTMKASGFWVQLMLCVVIDQKLLG